MLNPEANPLYRQVLYDGQKKTNIRTLQNHKNQIAHTEQYQWYNKQDCIKNTDKITTINNLSTISNVSYQRYKKPEVQSSYLKFFQERLYKMKNNNIAHIKIEFVYYLQIYQQASKFSYYFIKIKTVDDILSQTKQQPQNCNFQLTLCFLKQQIN